MVEGCLQRERGHIFQLTFFFFPIILEGYSTCDSLVTSLLIVKVGKDVKAQIAPQLLTKASAQMSLVSCEL